VKESVRAPTRRGARRFASQASYNSPMRSKITLLLLAAVALLSAMASMATPSYAETRLWGFESETPAGARGERVLSATGIEGYRLAYDEPAEGYPLVPGGGGGRGAKNLKPDPGASGPHSTRRTDGNGNTTNHAEWQPNARNPSGFDEVKRVDLQGRSHFNKVTGQNMPTPHTHGRDIPGGVRPAQPSEIPGGGS
jgi:hypothetical protein